MGVYLMFNIKALSRQKYIFVIFASFFSLSLCNSVDVQKVKNKWTKWANDNFEQKKSEFMELYNALKPEDGWDKNAPGCTSGNRVGCSDSEINEDIDKRFNEEYKDYKVKSEEDNYPEDYKIAKITSIAKSVFDSAGIEIFVYHDKSLGYSYNPYVTHNSDFTKCIISLDCNEFYDHPDEELSSVLLQSLCSILYKNTYNHYLLWDLPSSEYRDIEVVINFWHAQEAREIVYAILNSSDNGNRFIEFLRRYQKSMPTNRDGYKFIESPESLQISDRLELAEEIREELLEAAAKDTSN